MPVVPRAETEDTADDGLAIIFEGPVVPLGALV